MTRDGTDYGEREAPMETKVAQVWHQLDIGAAVIVFNQEDGGCTILPAEQVSEAVH